MRTFAVHIHVTGQDTTDSKDLCQQRTDQSLTIHPGSQRPLKQGGACCELYKINKFRIRLIWINPNLEDLCQK